MTHTLNRRLALKGGFLLSVVTIVAGVWWFAFTSALDQLETRGRADLALASDRLTGQLQRFRELSVLLADHPTLTPVVLQGAQAAAAEARLLEMADKTGSLALLVAGRDGAVIAASGPVSGAILNNVALRPSFRRAMHAALGTEHWVEADTGQRIFAFAAPILQPGGAARGAVMVQVDIEALEAQTPTQASPVYFRDARGLIIVTNRSELILTSFSPHNGARFTAVRDRMVSGHEIWSLDLGPYLPKHALHLTQPLPVIGMTSEILLDLTPAFKIANLQAMVAAAFCLAFGAMLYIAAQRLRTEAATNLALEARVTDRTQELSLLNADLLREIAERKEAETALTRAQAELVQAGKLSALGQMSAGISHELNQPLMAIQSFAENGEILLDRGKPEAARENLGKIGELANRMGRIIRNLRAFARQETVPVSDVDVLKVIAAALEIARPKIDQAGVVVDWTPPMGAIMVRGGEVRLQQVVMNLLSNAVDAMEASDRKELEIRVLHANPVTISIRDTGAGIDDAEKIFDPFYSTKKVGEAAGMGLGLSISYGVVQSFGGAIRGRNHPGGGAIFTVELTPAQMEQAA
jgi:two-component system C4-dicarboxylate transport sensor histidine kinase DctB